MIVTDNIDLSWWYAHQEYGPFQSNDQFLVDLAHDLRSDQVCFGETPLILQQT